MRIHLRDLRYTYRGDRLEDRTVLGIDNWTADAGAQVLLRGISGSGKTTLLNVLAGLLPPTQGAVHLDDQALYALPEAQRDRYRATHIGYVFQMHLLVPTLSAVENVEMPLVFAKAGNGADRRRQSAAILEQVGLGEFTRHRPMQLSAGQRLRVAVARALVARPRLLLADEPTAALDQDNAHAVMDLLQARCREAGATLIVASHDPALNTRFDRVVDLRHGALVDQPVATPIPREQPA
jgi:putative ABC transport system ATP-binding protein